MALIKWQTGAKISLIVLVIAVSLILGWDLLAIVLTGAKLDASVSQVIWKLSTNKVIPFGTCFVVGHLFLGNPYAPSWLMKNRVSKAVWKLFKNATFIPFLIGAVIGLFLQEMSVVTAALLGLVSGHAFWGDPEASLEWAIKNKEDEADLKEALRALRESKGDRLIPIEEIKESLNKSKP